MADPGAIGSIAPAGEDYLVKRIAALETKVRELGPSIAASFNTTVASLNATIASLNTTIANVSAQAANQVSPATAAGSAAGFALTTSYLALVSFSLIVPSGYTRALVTGCGSVTSLSAFTSSDAVRSLVQIAGSNGAENVSYFYAPNSGGASTSFQTVSLSGLTGGSGITVTVFGHLNNGPGSTVLSTASLVAQAIYLK